MVKSKSNKKRDKSGSLFDSVDLNGQRPKQMERANYLFKFIQGNPDCTRKDMVKVIRWATKDNLRRPIRILMTQGRIWINAVKQPWKFSVRTGQHLGGVAWSQQLEDDGKIEVRACQGTKKDGTACRVPSLYISEDGYCKFHRGQSLQSKKPIQIHIETDAEYAERIKAVVAHDSWNAHSIEIAGWKVEITPPQFKEDDKYKQLIIDFLAGDCTVKDLKEAIE